MKNFLNKKITKTFFILLLALVIFFSAKKATEAVTEQYYGGLRLATIQCTCSTASIVMIYDYKLKTTLNLVYLPGFSRLFSNYNLYTSTYMIGSYNPTMGTGICMFVVGNSCVDSSGVGLPAYGTMDLLPGAGTSMK